MANISSGGVAGSRTSDIEGTDISGRNVDRLQAGALGLPSIMLLSNYAQSIGNLFVFLSVVVTAANLPVYFSCTLAIVVLGRQGLASAQRRRTAMVVAAAICAAVYCAWVSIGIGLKPLLWTVALGAVAGIRRRCGR